MTRSPAPRWLSMAVKLLPPGRRDLAAGLLAEAGSVPPGRRRWVWLAGGAWFVARELVMHFCAYWLVLAGLTAGLAVLNWMGSSDDAPQVVLMALLAVAAGLGWAVPRRVWVSGVVIGAVLPVMGIVQAAGGVTSPAPPEPGGIAGAATLFVLLVPVMLSAHLGAAARRRLSRPE